MAKSPKSKQLTDFASKQLTTFDRSENHMLQPSQTVIVFTKVAAPDTVF